MRLLGVLVLLFGFSGTAAAAEPIGERISDWWEDIRSPDRPGTAEEVGQAVKTLAERVDYLATVAGAAVDNATTPELRELAADLETEYLALGDELGRWAQDHDVTLGQQMPERFTTNLDELSALKGEAFDVAFLDLMREESVNIGDDIDALMKIAGRGLKSDMREVKRVLSDFDDRIQTLSDQFGSGPGDGTRIGEGTGQGAQGRQNQPGGDNQGDRGGFQGGDQGGDQGGIHVGGRQGDLGGDNVGNRGDRMPRGDRDRDRVRNPDECNPVGNQGQAGSQGQAGNQGQAGSQGQAGNQGQVGNQGQAGNQGADVDCEPSGSSQSGSDQSGSDQGESVEGTRESGSGQQGGTI